MLNQLSRTELLIGRDAVETLKQSHVAVFGIGGVGGYVVEALARSGIGAIDLIDNDKVCLTNINRQIYAAHSTIGRYKTDIAEERIKDINPEVIVKKYQTFYTPETKEEFDFSKYDYVIDAIDTVVGKLSLIEECKKANVPIICAMGAGNKLNPTKFEVADISKTSVCPLARVIRQELKKRKIKGIKVVFSKEEPLKPRGIYDADEENTGGCSAETVKNNAVKRQIPGSIAFCPSVMGLIIAGEVVKDLSLKG